MAHPESSATRSMPAIASAEDERHKVSGEIEAWLDGDGDKTLGGLIDMFEEKSFAILFVFLLGVPALPLPTGGATHVFEIVAALLALQLIAGRDRIWLPERWRGSSSRGPSSSASSGADAPDPPPRAAVAAAAEVPVRPPR